MWVQYIQPLMRNDLHPTMRSKHSA